MSEPTPENVECPTCDGEGQLVNLDRFGPDYRPCPDCTPEIVECPTCGGTRWIDNRCPCCNTNLGPKRCPDCTPENVETVVFECHCQCHLPMGFRLKAGQTPPPIMRPCSACVADHSTPENVETLPIYGSPDAPVPAGVNAWIWHSPNDPDLDRRGTYLCRIIDNETQMTRIPTPENVECPRCGGSRKIRRATEDTMGTDMAEWYWCPDCWTPENVEKRRCDGSHACPAERHIFGCFRSTLADDVEGHPNWLNVPPPRTENVETPWTRGDGFQWRQVGAAIEIRLDSIPTPITDLGVEGTYSVLSDVPTDFDYLYSVDVVRLNLSTPENVETRCDYCGNGYPDAPYIQNCPKCEPENVESPK